MAFNLNRREVCPQDHGEEKILGPPTEKQLEFNLEEYWSYVDQIEEMKRECGTELVAEVEERIKEAPPRYCQLKIFESHWSPDEPVKYGLVADSRGSNLLQKDQNAVSKLCCETGFKNLSDDVEVVDYDFRNRKQADPYNHRVFGGSLNAFNYYDRAHIKKHLDIMGLPAASLQPKL